MQSWLRQRRLRGELVASVRRSAVSSARSKATQRVSGVPVLLGDVSAHLFLGAAY